MHFTGDSPDWSYEFVTCITFPRKDYINLQKSHILVISLLLENFLDLNYEVNQIPLDFKSVEYCLGEVEGKRFRGRPRMTLPIKIGKELKETSELGLRFFKNIKIKN